MSDGIIGTKRSKGGGAPTWMVTFADLMSLLLAFFVLLFTFSELDKQLYKQIAGSMRDAFGIQSKQRVKEPPKGVSLIMREYSPGKPQPTPIEQMRQSRADDTKSKVVMPEGGVPGEEKKQQDQLQKEAEQIKASLAEEIDKGSVEVEVTDQRITVRIMEQDAFPSGSAQPKIELDNLLEKMSRVLRSSGGSVVVSGHTDNVPINNERFRSNWELSAARAVSVVHTLMEQTGLTADRFMVEGAAETRPVDSNDNAGGRARNRRVEVTVVYADDRELPSEAGGGIEAPDVPADDGSGIPSVVAPPPETAGDGSAVDPDAATMPGSAELPAFLQSLAMPPAADEAAAADAGADSATPGGAVEDTIGTIVPEAPAEAAAGATATEARE